MGVKYMDIKGNYLLEKAFSGFDDDFNPQFITRDDALKAKGDETTDDGLVMAMIFARMEIEVTDTNIFLKYNTEFDDIAKKLAKANKLKANDGKYFVMKYDIKKVKGKDNTYEAKSSDDGEDSGEVTFTEKGFELAYNFYVRA